MTDHKELPGAPDAPDTYEYPSSVAWQNGWESGFDAALAASQPTVQGVASVDIEQLKEQASAWESVFSALDEVTNCSWRETACSDMSTMEAAVYAIRNLAAQAEKARGVPEYKLGSWFEARTLDEMQAFYLARLPAIREAAKEHGYAIGLHGSERRDFDLMAMQWRAGASDKDTLARAIAVAACGITRSCAYDWAQKPMGRVATSMPVCWTDYKNPEFADMISLGHIDLSIIEAAPQAPHVEPVGDDVPYTYASSQATKCAGCLEYKHTPLRIDAMGGYVCLTCIDKKLGSLLGEFGYPAVAPVEPVSECWSCKKPYMLAERSEADGMCPHCGVEIELELDEDKPAPAVAEGDVRVAQMMQDAPQNNAVGLMGGIHSGYDDNAEWTRKMQREEEGDVRDALARLDKSNYVAWVKNPGALVENISPGDIVTIVEPPRALRPEPAKPQGDAQ